MLGQNKFNPYGQFPASNELYDQEQYEEEDSVPLVEEFDQNYEPTDKQVRQYALDTLGLRLPQDQSLLYLAREGLKAPLPPNWVPYQSRDGQYYYKHRITQEKTYEHPTDVEYRNKVQQTKQKAARKNLKSMNLNQGSALGIGGNSSILPSKLSNKSGLGGGLGGGSVSGSVLGGASVLGGGASVLGAGPSGLAGPSVLGSAEMSAPQLDPALERQLEQQVKDLEERLKKEWREYEKDERGRSQQRLKRSKEDYESQIGRIQGKLTSASQMDSKLQEEKERLKDRIQEQMEMNLQGELRQHERQLEDKNRQYQELCQEENRIKVDKHQREKEEQFQKREEKAKQAEDRGKRFREQKRQEKEQALKQFKAELESGRSQEIEEATQDALQKQLKDLKQSYDQKSKQRSEQLQHQYSETKRVLGHDQGAYLAELASRRSRLMSVSQQKIEAYRRKEEQAIQARFDVDLQNQQKVLKQKLENSYVLELEEERRRQEGRVKKEKERMDREAKQRSESQLENVYEQMRVKLKVFEADMNKKLSQVQQKFIGEVESKGRGVDPELTMRMEIREKEGMVDNKQHIISSLNRQIELEGVTMGLLQLQAQLSKCQSQQAIDEALTRIAKQHGLEYRTERYQKAEKEYREFKQKFRQDKEFLASVMTSLQKPHRTRGTGGAALLKKYNEDVRRMRQNEQKLREMELLLRKAEANDQEALLQIQEGMEYKEVELKAEIGAGVRGEVGLSELAQAPSSGSKPPLHSVHPSTSSIEHTIRQHSQFLSKMRGDLNRKLYSLRSGSYY